LSRAGYVVIILNIFIKTYTISIVYYPHAPNPGKKTNRLTKERIKRPKCNRIILSIISKS